MSGDTVLSSQDAAPALTRRRFLAGVAGATGAVVGGTLLAACQSAAPPAPTAPQARTRPTAPPATSPDPRTSKPLDPPVTVHAGDVGALAFAGQYIALERGYFEAEGLQIEFTPFDAAARMVPALGSGQLDIGAGAISVGLVNALSRGVPVKVVGPLARHDPDASAVYLMLRKDLADSGAIQDYADFKGRKVAIVAADSTNDYFIAQVLARGGLTLDDVEMVVLPFSDMISAFGSGAIDIALPAEPAPTAAVDRGVAVKWREAGAVMPGIQYTGVLYGPAFLNQLEAARRWMVAYLRGVRDYHEAFVKKTRDPAPLIAILTKYTPVKDPSLYSKMGFTYIDPNGRINEDSIADQLKWFAQRGSVERAMEVAEITDMSFVDYAISRLGRYDER
jgi:NitT/TauT family transport system substrate-binding protein